MKAKKPNSCNSSLNRPAIKAAMDRREALIQLCELTPVTSRQVAEHFKVSISVARWDLAKLCGDGWIESTLSVIKNATGKSITIATYAAANGNNYPAQVTRTSWEPDCPAMYEPMAYLFGRVPQEALC